MRISNVSIDRPVLTAMVASAVVVLGGLAIYRLGVDLYPNISLPVFTVVTPYTGAGPEEVESQVTRPIEEALSSINGVDEVRSYSRESMSTVIVTFQMSADVQRAAGDVRDRIALVRPTFPRDVLDPTVSRLDASAAPILTYSVASSRDVADTRLFVDDVIRPALERVNGVASVTISGGTVRELRVELDTGRLEAFGVTVNGVAAAIGAEGFDLPSGRLTSDAGEVGLKASGRFRRPDEVGEVVLATLPSGSLLRVRDVGRVVESVRERRTLTRVDGVECVTFEIQKQAGTNTVAVVDGVERAIARLRDRLPPDVTITNVIDGSRFIRSNMSGLWEALILGAILAVVVIFLFMLDWRSTLISAVALPTSVIAAFFVMWQFGFSLNLMTMMALSLSIGMLIDDSVVVRENIFRHMERGEDPIAAARNGTSEIALAVMATTFTVVAVFGPIVFVGGMIGKMFREFGVTTIAAVLASLIVSFTLDPMLSSRIVQKIAPDHHDRMRRHRVWGPLARGYDALDGAYRRVLRWALGHRKTVAFGAVVVFAGSLGLTGFIGSELFGGTDLGNFDVNIELPAGTSLEQTDRMVRRVEDVLRDVPEVVTLATVIGPGGEVSKASIRVKAKPKLERTRSLEQIMEAIRPRLSAIPGLDYNMRIADESGASMESASSVAQAPIVLYVRGPDYGSLAQLARQARDVVEGTRGVRDVAMTYRPGMPEVHLVLDRARAANMGVSFASVAAAVQTAVEGAVVAKYQVGEHDREVRVQLEPEDRGSIDQLLRLPVPAAPGRTAYLRDVAHLERRAMPATIERLDRERQITVAANVSGRPLGDVVADIQAKLDRTTVPAGYSFRFAGEAEIMEESMRDMAIALVLAVLFIYFVLASQFESFLHPFTIMLSLPLAVAGALSALFLFRMPLSVPAMIGIVLLMGLVTKNAILLVDFTNQLRGRGLGIVDALLEAGPTRLRPILMTSAAMVLGMLPMAIGSGEGSEMRAPMSIAVIGGVVTSTLLTLVVVPVFYVWMDRLTLRGRRERKEAARRAAASQAADAAPAVQGAEGGKGGVSP